MRLHEILDTVINRYIKQFEFSVSKGSLRIFETGSIRDERQEVAEAGDGWSTVYFASLHPECFISYDLDTSVAKRVLEKNNLERHALLIQEHSIDGLARCLRAMVPSSRRYDIAFLDSDNDPQLILHEFLIAKELVRSKGLIIVDDCCVDPSKHDREARKGNSLLPWLIEHRDKHYEDWKWEVFDREGWNGYKTGVLVIERF